MASSQIGRVRKRNYPSAIRQFHLTGRTDMNRHVSERSGLSEQSDLCKQNELRNPWLGLRLRLELGAAVLAALGALAPMVRAQAPAQAGAPLAAAQNAAASARVTQPIDETNRITLRGNTHPLARP